jgi:hypothetical protein
MVARYLGLDVQVSRPCTYALLNSSGELLDEGDMESGLQVAPKRLRELIDLTHAAHLSIGIDAPRTRMTAPRQWYWSKGHWRQRTTEKGWGRHCEVAIFSEKLARPQWTPWTGSGPCEPWMELGFELFACLRMTTHDVFEVFPSASCSLMPEIGILNGKTRKEMRGAGKDRMDALVAAKTIYEHEKHGPAAAIGGGDGLGEIILPKPISRRSGVHLWPGEPAFPA